MYRWNCLWMVYIDISKPPTHHLEALHAAQVLYGCCISMGNNGQLITGNRYLPKRARFCMLENIVLTVNKKSYQDQYECNQIIGTSQMLKPWEEINVGSKLS